MDQVSRNVGHVVSRTVTMNDIRLARPRCGVLRRGGLSLLCVLPITWAAAGCKGLDVPIAQWRSGFDKGLTRKITKEESSAAISEKVEEPRTLLGRWLNPKGSEVEGSSGSNKIASAKGGSTTIMGSDGWSPMLKPKANPDAEKEVEAALALFKQGKFSEGESAFSRIAKNRKGTHWGETGQYYLAECQYQQRKYVKANDSFEQLFADYPGTTFMDKMISREYALAQMWMSQGLADGKDEKQLPWYTRFTGEQPLLDTHGTGLKALEHVRHHDPTGPLADDAVMQIADYHMKVEDYESAAIYYDQLITDHPKSPFVQKAQLAAIDARLKGYLGPEYDGSGLEKARAQVRQAITMFPDRQASYDKLYNTLDVINDQEAERTFKVGEYYKRIGKVTSAEFYFGKLPQRWPNSPWAVKAKAELAQLAKMSRTTTQPSKIMMSPGATDPYFSAGPSGMGMGGMGMSPGGMM